jgi:hypothetical protein
LRLVGFFGYSLAGSARDEVGRRTGSCGWDGDSGQLGSHLPRHLAVGVHRSNSDMRLGLPTHEKL